jgi:hypothetical protein
LFRGLQNHLSPRHRLYAIEAHRLDSDAIRAFEPQLHEAAKAEGATPSRENLPRDGSMVSRERIDPNTNHRQVEFFGRESFIKAMSRPGQLVHRIMNPKSGKVLFGPPFPNVPTAIEEKPMPPFSYMNTPGSKRSGHATGVSPLSSGPPSFDAPSAGVQRGDQRGSFPRGKSRVGYMHARDDQGPNDPLPFHGSPGPKPIVPQAGPPQRGPDGRTRW